MSTSQKAEKQQPSDRRVLIRFQRRTGSINAMSEWIDIHEYRDFYDVPRIFVIDVDGRIILFDCQFVDELDEYSDEYKIYELSDTSFDTLSDDWTELSCLLTTTVRATARRESVQEFRPPHGVYSATSRRPPPPLRRCSTPPSRPRAKDKRCQSLARNSTPDRASTENSLVRKMHS